MQRAPELQQFFDATHDALAGNVQAGSAQADVVKRIFTALERPAPPNPTLEPTRQPACRHLHNALAAARKETAEVVRVADALATLDPTITWLQRRGAEGVGGDFMDVHANAMIAGPEGMEQRRDVMVGLSLMAPERNYPDHRHPPEEIYLVLSPGEWRQDEGPWHAPGAGGLVHNPPNILHAMRSTNGPLLAVWSLWLGKA